MHLELYFSSFFLQSFMYTARKDALVSGRAEFIRLAVKRGTSRKKDKLKNCRLVQKFENRFLAT